MYRGTVKNGVVVIDGEISLKEGARVTIEEEPNAPGVPRAGSPKALLRAAGKWSGPPGELGRLLAQLREMKQRELAAERANLTRPARAKRNGRR